MNDGPRPKPDEKEKSAISTVTLLVTDLEDSTHLWEMHPEAMGLASSRHDQIIEEAIRDFSGATSKSQWEGDSVVGIFKTARQASACAMDLQRQMLIEPWPDGLPIKLRIALYTGEALVAGGMVSGPVLSRAVALRNLAEGGQILVSQITAELLRQAASYSGTLLPWGSHRLRVEMPPEEVFQLSFPDRAGEVPTA